MIAQSVVVPEHVPGVKEMLMGPAGSGKTYSIGTLVDTGMDVFYLALEPGIETLQGYYIDRGQPIPPNLHYHYVAPPAASFTDMLDMVDKTMMLSFDSLCKVSDPKRTKHNQFQSILKAMNNFTDDRTGEQFGDVGSWGNDRVLVIDSMSGLGRASMSMVVGSKPIRNQAEWGMAQTFIENLIVKLCNDCRCHFILLSHVEREVDQVMGGVKIMASTLGKALAPKLPSLFSDVILCARSGTKWTWDTVSTLADVKARYLPFQADNPPSFGPIIAKWRARWGVPGEDKKS